MLLMILMAKKLLEHFTKTNQKQFRVEKVIRKKGDKCMLNEKDTIIPLIATWIKKKAL